MTLHEGEVPVLESLSLGGLQAKVQLDVIQEASLGLEDNTLTYLTFYFYLAKRLELVADELEGRFREQNSTQLREFVEKKAAIDDAALSRLRGTLTSNEEEKE